MHCLKCTLIAGKLGNTCRECLKKLNKSEKEKIKKAAMKLQYWAKNGYYIFICFIIIGLGSLSFSIIYWPALFLGLAFVTLDLFYGIGLFKYLTRGKEQEKIKKEQDTTKKEKNLFKESKLKR